MNTRTVVIYCQYYFGVGHVIRSMSIASALAKSGYNVHVVIAGNHLPDLFNHHKVTVSFLPMLRTSKDLHSYEMHCGAPPNLDFFKNRAKILGGMLADLRPEWFITEHFPFGRRHLHLELDPLFQALQILFALHFS